MTGAVATVAVTPGLARDGEVTPPGDKSISQRLGLLLALAGGRSVLTGFLRGEDAMATLGAMGALGARVHVERGDTVAIDGNAGRLMTPVRPLDLGNSGTGLRLLTGLLAGGAVEAVLTGDASLQTRPMTRICDPLERMGADIELRGEKPGCAPLRIRGRPLHGIRYEMPVASAQVKSAVLLAGLYAEGDTTVVEPAPTRDHTERLLRALGLPVRVEGPAVTVRGFGSRGPRVRADRWAVPGDLSSAAFWIGAAAAREGMRLRVRNVGLNPRRTALLDVLRRMGAGIDVEPAADGEADWEPRGDLRVTGARLRGTEVGGAEVPNLIDELPILAVVGALAEGETRIRDAAELRVKESDRIAALCANLRAAGVDAEEHPDGLSVRGPTRLAGDAVLRSRGDHRVAMAFAVLALFARRPSVIEDVACVATSYPGFWTDLARLGGGVERL